MTVDGDDRLNDIETAALTRVGRRGSHEGLASSEQKSFASINSSDVWLGVSKSLLCSFFGNLFRQSAPTANVSTICSQSARLNHLKRFETSTQYNRPTGSLSHYLSVIVFYDAGRSVDTAQICHIGGLLIYDFALGSIFRVISWPSLKHVDLSSPLALLKQLLPEKA